MLYKFQALTYILNFVDGNTLLALIDFTISNYIPAKIQIVDIICNYFSTDYNQLTEKNLNHVLA